MDNDAVLNKALSEIARLELVTFKQAVVIETLQNEIRMRDRLKEGDKNASSNNTKHEQANNQSKSRGTKR